MIEAGLITAISQTVTRIFRLSRAERLQASIGRHIKLYGQMKAQDGLEQSAKRVASLIDLQTKSLVDREAAALALTYEWNTFLGALIASMILGSPVYWLIKYRYWWTTTILVIDAFFVILFMAIGIISIRKTPQPSDQSTIGSPQEQIDVASLPPSS